MKLIERILDKDNVRIALEKVIANKGAAGIDGMKVEELRGYMNANWPGIKQSILERSYRPAPVRRVEIPKPNGGVRKLGIPTAVDRTLQQSIVQILTPIFETEFQENSYGFRPGRSESPNSTAKIAPAGAVSRLFSNCWNTSTRGMNG